MPKARLLLLLLLFACSPAAIDPPNEGVTYYQHVAPILSRSCVSCHQPGSIAGSIPLTTYQEVAPRAAQIMDAVRSKRMPPSVVDVSGACGEFRDPRLLPNDDLMTILAWAQSEQPMGKVAPIDPPKMPPAIERVDLTVEMPVAYDPARTRADDYRCFVIDPMIDRDRFLTAYEVMPGEPRTVHHVILFGLANEEADAEALALDEADPGPGYECFGGPGVGDFRFLAGWAPGTGATKFPASTGLKMPANRKTVLQVHYNLSTPGDPDRTMIAMQLEDQVAEEAIVLPLADLEMELEPNLLHTETAIEVTLGENDRYSVLGAFPHMHKLGRSLRVERNASCMVDVPQWDFEWQEFFFFAQPIETMPGDKFRLTCSYDTRGRSEPVRWGEGTNDEMCLVGFYVVKR